MCPHVRMLCFERAARKPVALGELGVHSPGPPVGHPNGPKELLLEAFGGVLVELLVGLAQVRQRGPDLIGGRCKSVEQLRSRLCRRVAHHRRG